MAVRDPVRRKLTLEDFLLFPEDGQIHEIIDGEHYVASAPFNVHQRLLGRLTVRIGSFVEQHGLGELFPAPAGLVLSEHDIFEPDLLFVSAARSEIVTDRYTEGSPDLVVEILSRSTQSRDEKLKFARYERFGVAEYWIVDPAGTIRVYRLENGRFRLAADLSAEAGDELSTPLLPGLAIPLRDLFR